MSPLFSHLLIPFVIAIFLAINMGGSGTGPAFSAAYGSNVLRKSLIPGLFGIMVFLGAILAGKGTATTLGKDLLDPSIMSFTLVSVILFSVAISLLVANLAGIPQSTSQATVLAIVAPAIYFHQLNSDKLSFNHPHLVRSAGDFFFPQFFPWEIYLQADEEKGNTMTTRSSNLNRISIINILIVVMSLYVAFTIGANNVANAAGPIASMTANELHISPDRNFILIMILSTLIVAPNFQIGRFIFGQRILENTGKEIVLFGKFEAVIIAFVSASLLLAASVTEGIPSSLAELNVAAILGIGVAKLGTKNIFRKTEVRKFFLMWIIAPTIAFLLSLGLTFLADKAGLL